MICTAARGRLLAVSVFVWCLGLVLVPGTGWGGPTPTVSVEQVADLIMAANAKGQRLTGYGLTVFEGTKIEKFHVEFRSVLWNMAGKHHYLFVKVSDWPDRAEKILEKATIVSGMSGSPVYISMDGVDRLVGAVSFGYPFAKEFLGGVTPIEYMLEVLERPLERPERLWDPVTQLELPGGGRSIQTPLYISGFSTKAMERVREHYKGSGVTPLSGGSAGKWASKLGGVTLEPGSAIGLQLVSGDFDWSASGTVTWVDGDKVLAFGHQFEGMGEAAYPITTAFVQGVVPMTNVSFKLAAPIKVVGSLIQDRNAAVAGLLNMKAKTIPVKYTVRNIKREKIEKRKIEDVYNVEIVNDDLYGPYLIRAVFYNLLTLSEPGATDNTVFVNATIKFKGYDAIHLSDAYYNYGDAYNGNVFAAMAAMTQNAMKRVELESVAIDVAIEHDYKVATIRQVAMASEKVKPGDLIDAVVTLSSYDRDDFTIDIKVPIPKEIKPGRHEIFVYGGGSAGWITDLEVYFGAGVRSVEDIVAKYNERVRADAIVSEITFPASGVRMEGTVYPSLPDTVISTLLQNDKMKASLVEQTAKQMTVVDWAVYGGISVIVDVQE